VFSWFRVLTVAFVLLLALCASRDVSAYSVLAHEASVDAVWESHIRPLLVRRYPGTSREALQAARSYAYGGSVIQDLGYYPFGNKFFSNVVHYVRSGDFVEHLVRDAHDVNEFAFALGALAHYATDNTGHPEAVNKSVALMFPKLRSKYGDTVTYVQSPASHVIVEFSFDIVQVAAGAYLPDNYHAFIGFQVAQPLLDRAFRETYGLQMTDVFGNEDLAISTYRRSVSELIPELTRVAWRDKHDEIARLAPAVKESAFTYRYTRQQFNQEFGREYRQAGLFARVIAFLYRLLPKIGPLKPLSFRTPTPEAEALFTASFKDARARYAAGLDEVAAGRLNLANRDFDTGKPAAFGEYPLADRTYSELLERLDHGDAKQVPPPLLANIKAFYAKGDLPRRVRKRLARLEQH